jgi:diguanylate cyclase (GGDEF)-like protein
MAVWRRYLIGGLMVGAVCVALPLGVGRDILYCLIGLSGAAAIMVGVRRNRPAQPGGWYLIAAGTLIWVLGDGLYAWYQHVIFVETFPSLADALYLAAYALFAAGLLVLVHSRGSERGPNTLLDTAIFTVALALPAWLFLITPAWVSDGEPTLTRLVGVAYPLCDVLIFAMLTRLATSIGTQNTAFRLIAGSIGALVAADSVYAVATFVPAFADQVYLLDFLWLASYVLWGTAALHPSMRTLSARAPDRIERMSTSRVVALVGAVAIGPTIIVGELIAGVPVHNLVIAISSALMVPLILVRIIRVVRQLENQATRLERLADTDYVTGLVNRRYFVDRLEALLGQPEPQVTGLLMVDLERFSEIDDTLGQRSADAILTAVGDRLGELTGEGSTVARMGNDLFGVLDPSITSGEEASLAATRIRQALERPIELPDLNVSVEFSIGAVLLPEDGAEPELALLRAEMALSVARARSERTARYGIEMESGEALGPLLIGELGEAIEHGDIVVHYQPQVEIRSGRVLGVEALVRWQHPRHGLLSPDTFIPAAEQTDLIGPLTQQVLDDALRQCASWQREGLDVVVAVNLSVRNLLDPGIVDSVRSALDRHGLGPRSLELEITESSAMVNPRSSIAVLGALADLGVDLSIDDYGTGQASLAYLQKLPIRRLKIDRSFVTGMVDDDSSAAIVASTIKLARVLRFDVVAEGVEDDETLLKLRDMRCSTAQGFALGPPVEATLLPELIRHIEERLVSVLGAPRVIRARPVRRQQPAG